MVTLVDDDGEGHIELVHVVASASLVQAVEHHLGKRRNSTSSDFEYFFAILPLPRFACPRELIRPELWVANVRGHHRGPRGTSDQSRLPVVLREQVPQKSGNGVHPMDPQKNAPYRVRTVHALDTARDRVQVRPNPTECTGHVIIETGAFELLVQHGLVSNAICASRGRGPHRKARHGALDSGGRCLLGSPPPKEKLRTPSPARKAT